MELYLLALAMGVGTKGMVIGVVMVSGQVRSSWSVLGSGSVNFVGQGQCKESVLV